MKKYFLNPTDIFLGILFFSLYNSLVLLGVALSVVDLVQSGILTENTVVFVIVCLILLTVPNLFIIRYVRKYSGRLYLFDDHLVLRRGKEQVRVKISDIKWIELKRDVRTSVHKGTNAKANWVYRVRLNDHKEDLNFFITNNVMLDLIEGNNLRIMPNEINEAYKRGQMDLRKKHL